MKHFQIRLHGTGYDQYDVECPHGQVYDLVHFLCIDVCTVGTYQRPPPVSFCCMLEKLKNVYRKTRIRELISVPDVPRTVSSVVARGWPSAKSLMTRPDLEIATTTKTARQVVVVS